jgi:hypothetical protein
MQIDLYKGIDAATRKTFNDGLRWKAQKSTVIALFNPSFMRYSLWRCLVNGNGKFSSYEFLPRGSLSPTEIELILNNYTQYVYKDRSGSWRGRLWFRIWMLVTGAL